MSEFIQCGSPILAIVIIWAMFMATMAVFDPEGFIEIVENWKKFYLDK